MTTGTSVEKEKAIWLALVLIVPHERDQKSGNDIKGLHRNNAVETDGIRKAADMSSNHCECQQKTNQPQI